jgi:peptidyl-prolyl cis-trans isomerase D
MAIIGKIREKSILLVIIIGLALLAFILTDYKSMFGASEGEYGVGHVFGEKIDQAKYSLLERKYGIDGAWNYYIDSTIMNKEYDELGIQVSDKEFESYLKGDTTSGFLLKPIQPSPSKATLLNTIGQIYIKYYHNQDKTIL